jgi:streptomycin 6-kinase
MIEIRRSLAASVGVSEPGRTWLQRLPELISQISTDWSISVDPPFADEAHCAWVAPCTTAGGQPAVLKLGFPHFEAANEFAGLRAWAAGPVVRVLKEDFKYNAALLERCEPGTTLKLSPATEQDRVIGDTLKRLRRVAVDLASFRPLSDMIEHWCKTAYENESQWQDAVLMCEGLAALRQLSETGGDPVLLATDLHAGNLLRAQREPWLLIDPKPFVGDRCYDATQHLLNCLDRLEQHPNKPIDQVARYAEVDVRRLSDWTFARLATNFAPNAATTAAIAQKISR